MKTFFEKNIMLELFPIRLVLITLALSLYRVFAPI